MERTKIITPKEALEANRRKAETENARLVGPELEHIAEHLRDYNEERLNILAKSQHLPADVTHQIRHQLGAAGWDAYYAPATSNGHQEMAARWTVSEKREPERGGPGDR